MRTRRLVGFVSICGLLMLAACQSESGINKIEPSDEYGAGIVVDPTSINFGDLDAGDESSAVVTITNEGTATLLIDGLTLEGATAFTVTSERMLDELPAGEFTQFTVNYTSTGDVDEGTVHVLSTDEISPDVPVTLTGGITEPILAWDPDPVDFGAVAVGEIATMDVSMSNMGDLDLEVDALTIDGEAFDADFPTTPFTLAAGESVSFTASFDADASGEKTGTITATTNAESDNDVELIGKGSSGPIAVCSVDPDAVTSHADLPTWYGDESYDPGGAAIVNYEWTLLSRPTGSAATMPSGGANRRDFEWDLAGEYVGQLVVTNDLGEESEPCEAVLTATPPDGLWIEMYWTYPNDDMDLHLLAPGGTLESSTTDCYYANCVYGGLDWGTRGVSEDDPNLDIDDISGTGPENTRIDEPSDGTYTVIVNDYPGSVYSGANTVYMNIYVGSVLVWSDSRVITGEDTNETFATVSFPDGTVTSR